MYYQEFQNTFTPFIFNTIHDDIWAIFSTAIQQYHAVKHILLGTLCSCLFYLLGKNFLKMGKKLGRMLAERNNQTLWVIILCVLLIPTSVFIRRGGSFNFNGSIYWKNAARMKQHLLNEAIFDDIQALYKASRIYKQFSKLSNNIQASDVRKSAARLSKTKQYNYRSLLPLLTKKSKGAKIEKPNHIFLIVAETYMLWPLLEKYQHLPIAREIQKIIQRPDSILIDKFLPASNGTMFAVTSILLGLPEINLLTANRPTAQTPYETALSVQLKRQGYKTRFFYGGFPSWENIGPFMKNQMIDKSFYFADLGGNGGVWGVNDEELFKHIEKEISNEPSFNLILTSTNHPPYTLNPKNTPHITSEEEIRNFIPNDLSDIDLLISRIQHFEYADYHLASFINRMYQKYPDSLFVITGDHASRWTLSKNPSLYEKIAVPLIFLGKGIHKQMSSEESVGSHMDIGATILELILPKDTLYYALGKDILTQPNIGIHAYHWISKDMIGTYDSKNYEVLKPNKSLPSSKEQNLIEQYIKDRQVIAAWKILKGNNLESY